MSPRVVAAALLAAALLLHPARASAPNCPYPFLSRITYSGGFQPANLSSAINATVSNGQIVLVQAPPDPNNLVLPFDEDVTVKFVGEGAAGAFSGMMSWHYMDQLAPYFAGASPNDVNGDGDPDFLQSTEMNTVFYPGAPLASTGVYWMSGTGTGADISAAPAFSDSPAGGVMPHVPNFLENTFHGAGDVVFQLLDDDADTVVQGGVLPALTLVGDATSAIDSIPDYDVNGDGTIDANDRTVNLGQLQGGRELVLSYLNYAPNWTTFEDDNGVNYWWDYYNAPYTWFVSNCFPDNLTCVVQQPNYWFSSKPALNQDAGAVAPSTLVTTIDTTCPFPSICPSGMRGWLTTTMLSTLQASDGITLPATTASLTSDASGHTPHVFAMRPANNDLRSLVMGFDGVPLYDAATRSWFGVTGSNRYFNSAVVLLQAESGGSVISNDISTTLTSTDCTTFGNSCIAPTDLSSVVISKLHFNWSTSFPGCAGAPSATTRIDLYYSVDDGASWHEVAFAPGSPGDAVVDVLGEGYSGNRLRWKAHLVTNQLGCTPAINSLNVGYEAIANSEYQEGEALPIGNVVVRGAHETRSATWTLTGNDASQRGHVRLFRLYDPDTLAADTPPLLLWDAGAALTAMSPDARTVFYNQNGTAAQFTATPISSALSQAVLTPSLRGNLDPNYGVRMGGAKVNGQWVYDLNADGRVDDTDAAMIVQWTRGWEGGVAGGTKRAWPLGGVLHGTPAVVGPPGHPWWVDALGTPGSERGAFDSFAAANSLRPTFTLAAAADGLLHAFDTGSFVPPSPGTANGLFAAGNSQTHWYGDGHELWAFVPAAVLPFLANALPALASYKPSLNPRPMLDTAIAVADVYTNAAIRTLAVSGGGRAFPFLTAVDVSSTTAPVPAWPADWTDPAFNGVTASPSVGPVLLPTGRAWSIATTSGIAGVPGQLMVFLIDAGNGATLARIALGATAVQGAAGSPAMVDSDGDGVVDRMYVVDTAGTLYKVNTATESVCTIAALGEPVFAPLAVDATVAGKTLIYLAGGGDPDGSAPPPSVPLHAWEIADTDVAGGCKGVILQPPTMMKDDAHQIVFEVALPAGAQVWPAPVTNGTDVYFAAATAPSLDVCAAGSGTVVDMNAVTGGTSLVPLGTGVAPSGGLRAYDGHLFVSSLSGATVLLGAPTWNNPLPAGDFGAQTVRLPLASWTEQ